VGSQSQSRKRRRRCLLLALLPVLLISYCYGYYITTSTFSTFKFLFPSFLSYYGDNNNDNGNNGNGDDNDVSHIHNATDTRRNPSIVNSNHNEAEVETEDDDTREISILLPTSMSEWKKRRTNDEHEEGSKAIDSDDNEDEDESQTDNSVRYYSNCCSRSQSQSQKDDMRMRSTTCQRVVVFCHKFGTLLVSKLFRKYSFQKNSSTWFQNKDAKNHVPNDKVITVDPDQGPAKRQYVLDVVNIAVAPAEMGGRRNVNDEMLPSSSNSNTNTTQHFPAQLADDFRMVVVVRNIYESLISGYLYHKSGKECWRQPNDMLNTTTNTTNPAGYQWTTYKWQQFAFKRRYYSYDIASTTMAKTSWTSLCEYLASTSVDIGLRAYIEYVTRTKYVTVFDLKAYASSSSSASSGGDRRKAMSFKRELNRRIKFVCYEDLVGLDTDEPPAEHVSFLFDDNNSSTGPGTTYDANATLTNTKGYDGGHSTDKDPAVREQLLDVIRDLDRRYYRGDIAWLNKSVITCY